MQAARFPRLRIAVSDCLRGTECRYNGGHAQDDFINQQLAHYADFFPFCPEAPVLGTPRETIQLVGIDDKIHVMGTRTRRDVTEGIENYTHRMVPKLLEQQIDGAVVKSRSPSCGLERIKVYRPDGQWYGSSDPMSSGVFTAHLQHSAPQLAIEEEGRLQDAWLRESFMVQVFTAARWREFLAAEPTLAGFQAFHRDHKYLLLSKNETLYRHLGALVATTRRDNLQESLRGYGYLLMELLAYRSKRGHVRNVLDHIYGYFKSQVSEDEKQHYHDTVQEFVDGIIPLVAVIKILEQFVKRYGSDYLQSQIFFHPYPPELALRSKITAYR
jgi:uncharacterized protein YbgA (DUF1722 family)/uncharacterized protein YbbK (DUF523 family)